MPGRTVTFAAVALALVVGAVTILVPAESDAPAPQATTTVPERPAGGAVVNSLGIEAPDRPGPRPLPAAIRRAEREIGGARQADLTLGDPGAPIVITEYADLRCAECATVHRDVLPDLIRRHVRPGRMQLQLRQLPLLGRRSESLARAALAASRQDRYWEFVQLAYLRAGVGAAAPDDPRRWAAALGLDVPRWAADRRRDEWSTRLRAALSVAAAANLPGLPVFLVRVGDGPLTVLAQPQSMADFERAIAVSRGRPLN